MTLVKTGCSSAAGCRMCYLHRLAIFAYQTTSTRITRRVSFLSIRPIFPHLLLGCELRVTALLSIPQVGIRGFSPAIRVVDIAATGRDNPRPDQSLEPTDRPSAMTAIEISPRRSGWQVYKSAALRSLCSRPSPRQGQGIGTDSLLQYMSSPKDTTLTDKSSC
jgi:hypothetical protein